MPIAIGLAKVSPAFIPKNTEEGRGLSPSQRSLFRFLMRKRPWQVHIAIKCNNVKSNSYTVVEGKGDVAVL